jgi:hypothetical protein
MEQRWLRFGLAGVTLLGAGLAGILVACSSDTTNNGGTSSSSSGSVPEGGASSSSSGGASSSSGSTPVDAGTPAKLQLVNAATDFGPSNPSGALRICYQIGAGGQSTWAPLPPLPNRTSTGLPFPGVFPGTGGPVDGTGVDLASLTITPYVMNAAKLEAIGAGSTVTAGNDTTCEDLIANSKKGALTKGADYWQLPDIAAGKFPKENSYILVLTGCAGDSTKTATECGTGFTTGAAGNGNLAIQIFQLDNQTKIDTDKMGVQYIQVSPSLGAAIAKASGGLQSKSLPAIESGQPADPATAKYFASDGGSPGIDYLGPITTVTQISGVTVASDSFTANPGAPALAVPIPKVAALSFGAAAAAAPPYANGASFTFIAVGDALEDPDGGNSGATFNTKSIHYLALPNNPTVNKYDPSK